MKLEEGMYVRTKNGIAKIIGFTKNYIPNYFRLDRNIMDEEDYLGRLIYCYRFYEKQILKASNSIIDLIEVEDYVNGELVVQVSDDKDWVFTEPVYFDEYRGEERHYCYNNSEIKSIVTKEQFESVKYEVKKDE